MDYDLIFAVNVRRERSRKKLKQDQLAHKAGLSSQYLSKLERAKSSPTLKMIVKISDALDVTPEDLLRPLDDKDSLLILQRIKSES
jgi:transcriptional regulator with XRE-family HTH domain